MEQNDKESVDLQLENMDSKEVFDFEIFKNNNVSTDTHVLMEIINRFIPLFQENIDLYCDIKKQMVDKYLNKPVLSIGEPLCFEVNRRKEEKSTSKNPDLKSQLVKIAKQLRQLNKQTIETKKQRELAVEQLNNEISHLQERISSYESIISNLQERQKISSRMSYSRLGYESTSSTSFSQEDSSFFRDSFSRTPQKPSRVSSSVTKTVEILGKPETISLQSLNSKDKQQTTHASNSSVGAHKNTITENSPL